MATMQDMFDLNTAIDQLKNVLSHDYNFETNDGELKTNVHIFAQNGKYSEIVQDAFTKFNRSVKDSLMIMINNLVDRRDEMTMSILQSNYQTMSNIHNETADNTLNCQKKVDRAYDEFDKLTAEAQCDDLDYDICIDTNCPQKAEDIKESLSERYDGVEGTDYGIL